MAERSQDTLSPQTRKLRYDFQEVIYMKKLLIGGAVLAVLTAGAATLVRAWGGKRNNWGYGDL